MDLDHIQIKDKYADGRVIERMANLTQLFFTVYVLYRLIRQAFSLQLFI